MLNEYSCGGLTIFGLVFLEGMKIGYFQSCSHCFNFSKVGLLLLNIALKSIIFEDLNSSAEIASSPLAGFIETHLTSTFQNKLFYVNDHTILVIWVINILFV